MRATPPHPQRVFMQQRRRQGRGAAVSLSPRATKGGIGVPQDHGEAIVWYRLAAEQDLTDSQAGPNTFESVMDLQMQAIAQYQLGGLYMEGLGVPGGPAVTGVLRGDDVMAAGAGFRDPSLRDPRITPAQPIALLTDLEVDGRVAVPTRRAPRRRAVLPVVTRFCAAFVRSASA